MFKVYENADGSTSIFCDKSGRFLYKIRKQRKNMGLGCCPVNDFDSPIKKQSCYFNVDTKESHDLQVISDEQPDVPAKESENVEVISDKKSDILVKECNLPTWAEEADEGFSAECITSEDFARCLNLVPTEKLKHESINKLKTGFPLRLLSRTKAFAGDEKFPDKLPITSSAGLNILKAGEQKMIYSDQTIEMKIESYGKLCHSIVDSSCVNHQNFRHRDKRSKNSKFHTTHRYAFNKTQRLDNLITIKTGLSPASRRLLLRCNKKLAVSIKRLPDEEVKGWMQKRGRLYYIPADSVKTEGAFLVGSKSGIEQNSVTYVDLCSDNCSETSDNDNLPKQYEQNTREVSSFQGVLSNSSSALHNRNGQSPKQLNTYFKKYKASPNSSDTEARNSFGFTESKLISNPRYNQEHCLPFSTTVTDKKENFSANSNRFNNKNSKTKVDTKKYLKECPAKNESLNSDNLRRFNSLNPLTVNSCNSLWPNMNISIGEVVIIPIVDLTNSPPNSPKKHTKI